MVSTADAVSGSAAERIPRISGILAPRVIRETGRLSPSGPPRSSRNSLPAASRTKAWFTSARSESSAAIQDGERLVQRVEGTAEKTRLLAADYHH
jgi:hypothetical protein